MTQGNIPKTIEIIEFINSLSWHGHIAIKNFTKDHRAAIRLVWGVDAYVSYWDDKTKERIVILREWATKTAWRPEDDAE